MNPAILRRLREAGGDFVPFAALGPCIQEVGRELDALDAFGFRIERHPIFGVAYRGPADRLCPDQIEDQLGTTRIGRRIAVWNRVASTNDLAARAAGSLANDGLVILAEEQTAGRGRRGRSWTAPPRRSLLMSIVLAPTGQGDDPAWLTALGAVAVAELVIAWTGAPARIKWPNDVRVGGKKIAGVLVERAAGAGVGAVVGIGLNVNLTQDDLPDALRASATTLQVLRGHPVDRSDLARDLIRRLDRLAQSDSRLGDGWNDLSEHVGQAVRVETGTGPVVGILERLDLREGLSLATGGSDRVQLRGNEVLSIAPAPAREEAEGAGRPTAPNRTESR